MAPIKWTADSLPLVLELEETTGIISGNVMERVENSVKIKAENNYGVVNSVLIIKIDDLLALTPPMGWNSWNTFTDQISDSLVRQIADSMVSTGMSDMGCQYVNIDDLWQLVERDSKGRIQINKLK